MLMGNKKSTQNKYSKMAKTTSMCDDSHICHLTDATTHVRRRPKRPTTLNTRQTSPYRTSQKRANHTDTTVDVQDLSLEMERLMLRKSKNTMPRCSTPTKDYCFHCCHDHREDCCLYLYDEPIDGPRYSQWKRDLEYPEVVQPRRVSKIPEAIAGNTTPQHFPQFTHGDPLKAEEEKLKNTKAPPTVYVRQFYYPFFQPAPAYVMPDNINAYCNPLQYQVYPQFPTPPHYQPVQLIEPISPVVAQPTQQQPCNSAFQAAAGTIYLAPVQYHTPHPQYFTAPAPLFMSLFS